MGAIWVGMGLAGTGCATGILQRGHHAAPIVEAAGPGTVFATIDEAAVDGLAYSYRRAKQLDGGQSALGGTVFKVAEGYSYETSPFAPRGDRDRVRLVLQLRDVAHFATYPKGSLLENRMNERHSAHDRKNVDQRDPLHRPAFILTPSLDVKSYMGANSNFVASILATESGVPSAH